MARTEQNYVAVIGAGAAGLFGAFELASQWEEVVIFNLNINRGGLAENGIYASKYLLRRSSGDCGSTGNQMAGNPGGFPNSCLRPMR
jgi:ribulose 1,5-bisphosphate synthetase/thiazole synthase